MQLLFFLLLLALLTPVLGTYLASVFQGKQRWLSALERVSYRACGVCPEEEMSAGRYLRALLLFNLLGFLLLLGILVAQGVLPFNPQQRGAVPLALAFNIAASFVTNTNWQAYAGETTLSYFSQMVGLTVQNFLSAASGCAALLALIRGLARSSCATVGSFWVDLVRMVVYVLLPLSVCLALFLVSEGSVQTLLGGREITTLEGASQVIPLGPVASQVAIKQLGSNGGGFFNVNSCHPFENPTALTSMVEALALLLIPAALIYMYGVMTGSKRGSGILLLVVGLVWAGGVGASLYAEAQFPSLEGKEVRTGALNTLLWSVSTSAAANGSVNCMLDSLSPLAGGVALFNMMLGELIFGGVGMGLASLLIFVLLTLFLSGLMVGRTPEYRGKKIEKQEMQWVCLAILAPVCLILIGSSIALLFTQGNKGPHGLTEILYAFTSAAANNGSAFAGLHAEGSFYQVALGVIMILGRLSIVVPTVALAGLMGARTKAPKSQGVLSTQTLLFGALLLCVILIIGALTFFPALSLGPILEHFLQMRGDTF